jgi:hypothetical protein
VPAFETKHGLAPCMVAPTKIIAGLGLSLGIDILEAPGATGDYRTLLTSKAKAIAKALSSPMGTPPRVFVPGEDEYKAGKENGYDFGFLHIKVKCIFRFFLLILSVILIALVMSLQAIDDAGHDKAVKLKVRGLEAVDRAIGQLARLLWEAENAGHYQYFLCVTGDHSTPVEYGDHSFEPVPFAICRLRDYAGAVGVDNIINTQLDAFPLPSVKSGEDLLDNIESLDHKPDQLKAFSGDTVCEFNEIATARGCLGRFPGSEMMGIIKKFIKAKND